MLILVLQRWLPKVPAVLAAVVLSIAATSVFGLAAHGVSVVGELPQGFPPLTIPTVRWSDVVPLLAGALAIVVVSLADTIATVVVVRPRTGQEVHGNQEMLGIGAANLAAGLFQGFPVSTSASRTAVAERAGREDPAHRRRRRRADHPDDPLPARPVPEPAAAGAGRGRDHRGAVAGRHPRDRAPLEAAQDRVLAVDRRLRRRGPARRAARHRDRGRPVDPQRLPPRLAAVRRPPSGWSTAWTGYHDVRSYPEAEHLPGLVIYRFDAPLFFANAKTFRDEVLHLARAEPAPRWIVVAAEPITDVDTTAADVLLDLDRGWTARAEPRVRRDEGPGPPQDRALRADPRDRPQPLLPDHRAPPSTPSARRPAPVDRSSTPRRARRTDTPRPAAEKSAPTSLG